MGNYNPFKFILSSLRKKEKLVAFYDGLPQDGDAAPLETTNLPVIVIGSGASGLAAARTLERNGTRTIVLEGRKDRIGGRIHSVQLDAGGSSSGAQNGGAVVVDAGAAWVDGVPTNPVYRLTKEAGLKTSDAAYFDAWNVQFFDAKEGRWMGRWKYLSFLRKCSPLLERLEEYDKDVVSHQSLADRLDREISSLFSSSFGFWRKKTDHARRLATYMLRAYNEVDYGAELRKIGYNALAIDDDYEEEDACMIQGGYVELMKCLARGMDIRLGQNVTQISIVSSENEQFVEVQTEDDSVYRGSHVIVTVSLGVLKSGRITFDPPLPEDKQEAIDSIGYGNLEKILFRFDEPFWRLNRRQKSNIFYASEHSHDLCDGANLEFPFFADVTDSAGSPVLVVFLVGGQSRSFVGLDGTDAGVKIVEQAKTVLQRMFPKTYRPPTATFTTSWQTDPFAFGSYSFPGIETRSYHVKELAKPCANGRILFAGEATVLKWMGFVGGAMSSGVREAKRILGEDVELSLS